MKPEIRMEQFTEKEQNIIRMLSDRAKFRFASMSRPAQKRLLRRTERLVENKRQKQGILKQNKPLSEKEGWQNGKEPGGGKHMNHMPGCTPGSYSGSRSPTNASGTGNDISRLYLETLTMLLLSSEEQRQDNNESSSSVSVPDGTRMIYAEEHVRSRALKKMERDYEKNQSSKAFRKRYLMKDEHRKKFSNGTQKTREQVKESIKRFFKEIGKFAKEVVKAMNPAVLLLSFAVVFLLIFICVAAVVAGGFGSAGNQSGEKSTGYYEAQVSVSTGRHRSLVEKYCEQYEIEDYVDLVLAMIEQESGGKGTDVMQSEQSYYNTDPPIDTVWESIDYGVHQFSDCVKTGKCKNPNDKPGISLALQGYNYGNGYIDWALKKYKGYSLANAKAFSKKMCKEKSCDSYGDPEYVPHVLRYYHSGAGTQVTNEKAAALLTELRNQNAASEEVWQVISKGASLVGLVTYGMFDPPRQDDGRDNPTVLDCSSFTAWAFHKSGFSGIPYTATTATFLTSTRFTTISADELKPGDIGLKSATAGTGGANHVGIYCGKRRNGTKVWLHCTSLSSSSLTGNASGVMFGAYTNFTYFRRFEKFSAKEEQIK